MPEPTGVTVIAKPPRQYTPQEQAYIDAARQQTDNELEIDDEPELSKGEDAGCWVAAWVWVTDDDAGICRECGEAGANDGEGFDGMCGTCADKDTCEECGESISEGDCSCDPLPTS